mgnify:FL=1
MLNRTLLITSAFTFNLLANAQTPAVGAATPAAAKQASPLVGPNLLKNPGAEATDAAGHLVWAAAYQYKSLPYRMTVEAYGSTPGVFMKGWGEKNKHGANYFRFSAEERAEVRTQEQRFDLTSLGDTIDKGRVIGRVAGYIGAIGNKSFKGNVVVEYRNSDDKVLKTIRTPNMPYDVQLSDPKLTRCSQTLVLPVGTRYAAVYLSAYFESDADLSGSLVMDDVSFELIYR